MLNVTQISPILVLDVTVLQISESWLQGKSNTQTYKTHGYFRKN